MYKRGMMPRMVQLIKNQTVINKGYIKNLVESLIVSNFIVAQRLKAMLIFQLLNQYVGIAKAAFSGCAAKINKSIKTNIIEILLLIMCIPRKINFQQFGRYGIRGEQCYRQTAERAFDWLGFNMNLAARYFHQYGKGFGRLAIAIDSSYVSKAGKMTDHIGRFWSGCAAAVKHGLEILDIGLVDADMKDCIMLRAVQTKNAKELEADYMTLP